LRKWFADAKQEPPRTVVFAFVQLLDQRPRHRSLEMIFWQFELSNISVAAICESSLRCDAHAALPRYISFMLPPQISPRYFAIWGGAKQ